MAFVLGAAYAALSAYWGLGGTALGATVGGAVEHQVRSGSAGGLAIIWAAAVVKLVAAVLPLAAVGLIGSSAARRWTRSLSWIEAATLTVYGLVLTAVGLLVQANVVHASPHADHRALAWHAFLWDPWFLAWGTLITIAMVASKPRAIKAERPTP